MESISAFFRLIRINNLLLVALSQLFLKLFLIKTNQVWYAAIFDDPLLYLVIGTSLTTAGGYIINDYYDVKIDVINRPNAVVIERYFSRRQAIIFHVVFTTIALYMGYLVNWKLFCLFSFSGALLWWYSNILKKIPFWGNLAVALLSSLSVLALALVYPYKTPIYFYSFVIFILTFIREIVKDMEDMEGDLAHGCKTVPIVYGIRKSKVLITILLLLFVLTIVTIPYYYITSIYLFLLLFIIPIVIKILFLLPKADKTTDFHAISSLCKWIMFIGVISILFFQ